MSRSYLAAGFNVVSACRLCMPFLHADFAHARTAMRALHAGDWDARLQGNILLCCKPSKTGTNRTGKLHKAYPQQTAFAKAQCPRQELGEGGSALSQVSRGTESL